jgi:hypothetical protein
MISIELNLEDISRDDAYDFSFPPCPQRCAVVEKKFPGLPLLIVDKEKRLVWGHDYLRFLRSRGQESAVIFEAQISPAAALYLNFNLSNRFFGLNLYEKLLFVKKISGLCPQTEIQHLAELDFTLNEFLLEKLEILLAEPFRTCLAAGRLGLKAALKIADMAEGDRLAMVGLLQACKFSESQQWLLTQWLEETAFREKKTLATILAASGLDLLLEKEMPQKKILDVLQALRYPEFARAEGEWRKWQKKMAAGCVSLAHAPFFASKEVQVTVTVKNLAAAEKLLAKLK